MIVVSKNVKEWSLHNYKNKEIFWRIYIFSLSLSLSLSLARASYAVEITREEAENKYPW